MLVETDASANRLRSRPKSALIQPLRRLLGNTGPHPPWDDRAPIRAELFSVERLEEHARSLAAAQGVMAGERKGAPLAKRLAENEAELLSAYREIAKAVDAGAVITPAAEWLIDNFHLIEKQIREIRADLPAWLLSAAPQARQRTVRGIPARFRRDVGFCGSYRQPLRPRDSAPLPPRLSRGPAADHRRALGRSHHVADRADRKPQADRQEDRGQRRRPTRGRCSGRQIAGRGEPRARTIQRCAASARRDDVPGCVPCASGLSPARSGSQYRAGVGVARPATGAAGDDRRCGHPRRAPAAGHQQCDGAQHHHQHAPHLRRRLD